MQYKFSSPSFLLLAFSFLLLFPSCSSEEEEAFPTVPGKTAELVFEEGIKGNWNGLEYFIEYFDEDGKLLFKKNEKVFIKSLSIDEEFITFRYTSSSPDWWNKYTTRTVDGENFIEQPGWPDMHVTELTMNSMIWEETTDGGSFDDNYGNIQVQADHQVRTFKFNR